MDMAEILGALLNKKSGGGGMGSVLKDLLGGTRKPPAAQARPERTPQPRADDLDGMLREADASYRRRRGMPVEDSQYAEPRQHSELDNERAKLLVCAMVRAAKADGQLDQAEQDSILGQLGDVTQEEVEFLRAQFAAESNVRDFTWSVPLGMEQQVYSFSLMAIGLDKQREAQYLKELAHGLRLQPDTCNQLHERFGAPRIFA